MKIFLILIVLIVITGSSRAAFFTNSPSVDSFVRSNAPTLNYGGAGSLSVSGSTATNGSGVVNGASDSFIRFNTAAMVANFNSLFGTNNWVISGTKLRTTEMGAPPNAVFNRGKGVFEIRWIANTSWTEGTGVPLTPTTTGITYNDELSLLNSGADFSLGTFTNAGVDFTNSFPFALPAAFTSSLKAGGEVGLYLTATEPGTGFTFNSRSFGTVSARPYLEISAVPRPGIVAVSLSGANVVLAATNGVAGGTYFVLSSTNVATPVNQWTPVATNFLLGSGNFTSTATNANTAPQQFFILQIQ